MLLAFSVCAAPVAVTHALPIDSLILYRATSPELEKTIVRLAKHKCEEACLLGRNLYGMDGKTP